MLADILHKVASMRFHEKSESAYYPRPSLAGPERCLRQLVYFAMNAPAKKLPGRAAVVFDDSSWHEELTIDLVAASSFRVHSTQMAVNIPGAFPFAHGHDNRHCSKCATDYPADTCHGHIDFIVSDLLDRDVLVEHKALSHFGFNKLLTGDELPVDYLTQLAIYLRGIGLVDPRITNGLLLVKNKNQAGFLEYLCAYDAATDTLEVVSLTNHLGESRMLTQRLGNITNDAFTRFGNVELLVASQSIPDRQYQQDHWRCEYCQYNQLCWSTWAMEVGQLAEDQALSNEIADACAFERQLAAEESHVKKERERVRDELRALLKKSGARSGRAGDYWVDWSVGSQRRLDSKLLEQIAPATKAAATVSTTVERLAIKKLTADNTKKE